MVDHYPDIPGAQGPEGTSQEAAEAIAPTVSHLRRIAMRTLNKLGEATVLEAVAVADVARESLQPRFSELRAMGLVEPTGARRRNPSGKRAAVWRLTPQGRAML
ncbi:MAG: winged helix-turn-helix transcriptional regulator [Sphingomonadales bacterium]|nr:winged helix-turn-helix transcriptional regulator [Sphingomonadales bacterium]MBU3992573.1 MarR family winged helix-turn-helix transcriptional regulator [Alphaproteobacteria bacterium]